MTFEQTLIVMGFSIFVGVGSGALFWLIARKLCSKATITLSKQAVRDVNHGFICELGPDRYSITFPVEFKYLGRETCESVVEKTVDFAQGLLANQASKNIG